MKLKVIPKIRLEKLQNAEYYALIDRLVSFLTDAIVAKYKLEVYINPLIEGRDKYYNIYLANRKSATIPEIKDKEHERDNSFIVFKKSIELNRRSRSASKLAAAKKIKFMLPVYRIANIEDTLTSIVMLRGFVRDMQEEAYLAPLKSLGLEAILKDIGEENEHLEKLYRRHNDEKLYKKQGGNITELRKELSPHYREMIVVVSAIYGRSMLMKDAAEIAEIEVVVDQIIAEVDDLTAKIQRRDAFNKKKREEKQKKKEEAENPQPAKPETTTPTPPKEPKAPKKDPKKPKGEGEGGKKPEKKPKPAKEPTGGEKGDSGTDTKKTKS